MSLRQAAQQALAALVWEVGSCPEMYAKQTAEAITALRAALAEADDRKCTCHPDDNPPQPCPKQFALGECRRVIALAEADEPVAWMKIEDPWGGNEAHFSRDEQVGWTALYTRPRREPLTDEAVMRLYREAWAPESEANEVLAFARAVERAHGIGTDE